MARTSTRVRVAEYSDIIKLSKKRVNEILSTSRSKGGHGISEMVRNLTPDSGFFVVCEADRKFSHVYTVAKDSGIEVSVARGTEHGEDGYWIICTG